MFIGTMQVALPSAGCSKLKYMAQPACDVPRISSYIVMLSLMSVPDAGEQLASAVLRQVAFVPQSVPCAVGVWPTHPATRTKATSADIAIAFIEFI